ncbi:MAG: molybdopterin-synthase adenylyltransferase MoeB [Phycisphaerae bacterium]
MSTQNSHVSDETAQKSTQTTRLSQEQVQRYKRHLILPEVGMAGQKKLLNARVLVIGAGGLGCPIALYLAAAGVGTLGLADVDVVSPSNLQRQVLFGTAQVGQDKVAAAADRIAGLNPDVTVRQHKTIVRSDNVLDLIADYDIVIDGTDNFPTRYCVGDACVLAGKPNVYGSIFRFDGMVTVFDPTRPNVNRPDEAGPCYRCMYPEPPDPGTVPSCAEGGVLGVLPGIIGTLQANEVLKLICGFGKPAVGKLVTFNALDLEFRTFKLRRDPTCPVCGDNPTVKEPIDYEMFCGQPTLNPISVAETQAEVKKATGTAAASNLDDRGLPLGYNYNPQLEITPRELKAKLDAGDDLLLIDCRTETERQITDIGGQLIPLQDLPRHMDTLEAARDKPTYIYCRSGPRSLQMAEYLKRQGWPEAKSLAGGILLWNTDITPGGPQY